MCKKNGIVTCKPVLGLLITTLATCAAAESPAPPADEAVRELRRGNARFVAGNAVHPHLDANRRTETAAEGQKPFATILACSDSRVPVELIFDQGIGDLFVIRVAGNVCGTSEIASIEYGVEHLHTPLLVVMGHTHCGAVSAAAENADVHGRIPELLGHIKPVVDDTRKRFPGLTGTELLDMAIKANVQNTIETVFTKSPGVARAAREHKVKVLGAHYNIQTGVVSWLAPPREEPHASVDEEADRLENDDTDSETEPEVDAPAAAPGAVIG